MVPVVDRRDSDSKEWQSVKAINTAQSADSISCERRKISVRGTVQGVGFRPFIYRLAIQLGLSGWVTNDSVGVAIELQGSAETIATFMRLLSSDGPPLAKITNIDSVLIPVVEPSPFIIKPSHQLGSSAPVIPPDVAVCDDCLRELRDPNDRRFRYPFINCTNCGPRFTITSGLPYDRPLTTMHKFQMCPQCASEYSVPLNRRFHAQPNACPTCGPKLWLHNGTSELPDDDVVATTQAALRAGKIVALKSLGGFHLACDATNPAAIAELRKRKHRPHKPFAVMVADLQAALCHCDVTMKETGILIGSTRPIVLLRRKKDSRISPTVAPDTDQLGLMLPSTPLHHLLFDKSITALVMTSGNLTDEPIAIGNDEAIERLLKIADLFVLHDRDILQRMDDSIFQQSDRQPRILRRARGIVPEPITLPFDLSDPILACGAELKSTVAIGIKDQVVLSQHLGDLDNPLSLDNYDATIKHLSTLLDTRPSVIAHDLHPDYLSTRWARIQSDARHVEVQHHHAHLVSVMTENNELEPCLGIILDGSGYGTDGTIWGGELLFGDAVSFRRLAWLDPVGMPGGETAIHEPWRMALSYLRHSHPESAAEFAISRISIPPRQVEIALGQLAQNVNSPLTSSCGRLFDGVSALLGLCPTITYEAQAAILLERVASQLGPLRTMEISDIIGSSLGAINTAPLISEICRRQRSGDSLPRIARQFHQELALLFVSAAVSARSEGFGNRIALSGGVYQNKLFFEFISSILRDLEFEVICHQKVPTNDGGLSLGQLVIANAALTAHPEKRD